MREFAILQVPLKIEELVKYLDLNGVVKRKYETTEILFPVRIRLSSVYMWYRDIDINTTKIQLNSGVVLTIKISPDDFDKLMNFDKGLQ